MKEKQWLTFALRIGSEYKSSFYTEFYSIILLSSKYKFPHMHFIAPPFFCLSPPNNVPDTVLFSIPSGPHFPLMESEQ